MVTLDKMLTTDFIKKGYHIQEKFISDKKCKLLLEKIADYRKNHELSRIIQKHVDRSLDYKVITGKEIKEKLPEVYQLYSRTNQIVNQLYGEDLHKLENEQVGVNINITHPGGAYRWHYDRNRFTGILFLNEADGGETELYPNYRILVKIPAIQKMFDKILMLKLVRYLFGNHQLIKPETGKIIFMLANTGLHSVRPVIGNRERVTLIFAFDVRGKQYKVDEKLDKYLYEKSAKLNSDPNYI